MHVTSIDTHLVLFESLGPEGDGHVPLLAPLGGRRVRLGDLLRHDHVHENLVPLFAPLLALLLRGRCCCCCVAVGPNEAGLDDKGGLGVH